MKIPFWKLKEDDRLAAAVFPRARSLRVVFWIIGWLSKKNFRFVEGTFLRRNVTISCKKNTFWCFQKFGWRLRHFFFKTALYGCRGTIWKNLTLTRTFSFKFFQIFKKFGLLAKRFGTCGGSISVNIDKTAFQVSGGKNVVFQSCFPNMNELRPNVDKNGN